MITGILLAAGASKRFGKNKLLHRVHNNTPMVVLAARKLLRVVGRVTAVVRPGDEPLTNLLVDEGIRVISCDRADQGMGMSLYFAIGANAEFEGWVVALGDMPYVEPETIMLILNSLKRGAALSAPYHAGSRGHPVGFGKSLYNELVQLEGDIGARVLFERHKNQLETISVDDPGILRDIDTPADLGRF